MSFGNILLSLLLLGTTIVIGLIVLVYFKLTGTEKRINTSPTAVTAPVRPVEKMSPDGKPVTQNTATYTNNLSAANDAETRRKAAEEAVNNIKNDTSNTMPIEGVNSRALTSGAKQQVKKPPRRRDPNLNAETLTRTRNSTDGEDNQIETLLQPTNRERSLTPRDNTSQGERSLTPRRNNNDTENRPPPLRPLQVERPLTPIRPQNTRSSESIDELF